MTPQPFAKDAAAWLDDALAFWGEHGQAPSGAFYESLDEQAQPRPAQALRLRVQARQIYVFARAAAQARFAAGAALADKGFTFLLATRTPSGAYATRLGVDGAVIDKTEELYDQAFVLLACAAMAQLGDARGLAEAQRLLGVLDSDFARARGYAEHSGDGADAPRRQNPHMHLLEAFLALFAASKEAAYLERARAIYDLFASALFDAKRTRLNEDFDGAWRAQPSQMLEPGHYFEWVWLLHQFAAACQTKPPQEAAALFAWARKHGLDEDGMAVHGVGERAPELHARLWQQTEMLRACCVVAPHDAPPIWTMLQTRWLNREPRGLWWDAFALPQARLEQDDATAAVDAPAPASTLYHLWGALGELA